MINYLYLKKARARSLYACSSCKGIISVGARYFRHDPNPFARMYGHETVSHWCYRCIMRSQPEPEDPATGRLRVPVVSVRAESFPAIPSNTDPSLEGQLRLEFMHPLKIDIVRIGAALSIKLANDPQMIHSLSAEDFEAFVCDRLFQMGFEPRKTGSIFQRDGGIDIIFWPRNPVPFPFLCAAQVKHHAVERRKEGPASVRDFAGVMAGHPFNAGLIITNTSFTPNAEWYAKHHAKLIRLRGFEDIRRWLFNNFVDEAEWREIPGSIEISPGIIIPIR